MDKVAWLGKGTVERVNAFTHTAYMELRGSYNTDHEWLGMDRVPTNLHVGVINSQRGDEPLLTHPIIMKWR